MSENEGYYHQLEFDPEASLEENIKALYNTLEFVNKEMSVGRVPQNRKELEENIRNTEKKVTTPLSIAFVKMAEKGEIDEITASENANLFMEWNTGVNYKTDTLLQYEGLLYRVLQEHTSQEDWTPDITASLYKVLGISESGIPYWSQPVSSADAFMLNDEVMHNDKVWISDYDNNVWEPGVFGWHIKEETIETPSSNDLEGDN